MTTQTTTIVWEIHGTPAKIQSQVQSRAWEIARDLAATQGGGSRSHLSEAVYRARGELEVARKSARDLEIQEWVASKRAKMEAKVDNDMAAFAAEIEAERAAEQASQTNT